MRNKANWNKNNSIEAVAKYEISNRKNYFAIASFCFIKEQMFERYVYKFMQFCYNIHKWFVYKM